MKAKKILAVILSVMMLMSMMAATVAAENGAALPVAQVENLGAISADFEDSYFVYDVFNQKLAGESSDPLALNIAMQFTAQDSAEEAANSAYADYTTDFFIEMNGMAGDSIVADGCYLAGYYANYGEWVKIPLDGFEVENGKVYPVITSVGFDYKYTDICSVVENFICGVYLTPEVLLANPDLTVKLSLGLSEDADAAVNADFIEVDGYEYTMVDFLPTAEVNNLGAIESVDFGNEYYVYDLASKNKTTSTEAFGLKAAAQFVASNTAEEAAANAFADCTTDFFIKITGLENESFVGDDCYLAGYYADFGTWVKIPLDGITINAETYYPVISSAGFDFSYEEICTIVKDFTCGAYISDEVLKANPDLALNLYLGVCEDLDAAANGEFVEMWSAGYNFQTYALPTANVKNLGALESVNFGDEYYVYDLATKGKTVSAEPFALGAALQFVAADSAKQAAASKYADYTTDFFINVSEDFVADGCYLAGYYPSFGTWVKIPLDGLTINAGTNYPVISSVGFDFSYEDICTKVGNFVCGIYLSDEVLAAHPELVVNLDLGICETYEDALNGNYIQIADTYSYEVEDFGEKVTVWYNDTDAGYYWINDEKVGMMRFLFGSNIDNEDIVESGIKYILATTTNYESANGVSKTGDEAKNTFYGDVTGIPVGTTGTYLAIGYIKTADGTTHWSEIMACSPNFDRFFYQLSE